MGVSLNIEKQHIKYKKKFETQINFLCSSSSSKKNNKIISEYFFNYFLKSPTIFHSFIIYIKKFLLDINNKETHKLAEKYLDILSFLCERFGLYEEKLLLDDICFKIINPEEYSYISIILEKYKKNSSTIIDKILEIFKEKLSEHNIQAEIKGRYKNIYSIYKKCKNHNDMNVLKLNDIFAFRIIIDGDSELCFEVLNILHNNFDPIPKRFKDYITIPKINGYQSLHTGLLNVIPDLDLQIEVQVRNTYMDYIAENGVAAHFLYGRDKKSSIQNHKEEKLFNYITQSVDNSIDNIIYCFTPDGDIIKLTKGDTIIDFANKIHTNLGKHTKLAIINGKNKDSSYKIKNYDVVRIIKN